MAQPPIPYQFVNIKKKADGNPASVTDTPVFHDGKPIGEDTCSGEIRCTLEALTPLLVGNDQYEAKEVEGSRAINDMIALPQSWGINVPVAKDKKVLEPLRLKDGRVVLPGTGIKGMLRQSLGALLSAPMERVEEKSYSYRPNLAFGGGNPKREPRPAVVIGHANGTLQIKVLPGAQDAVFIRNNAINALGRPNPGNTLTGTYPDVEIKGQRLFRKNGHTEYLNHHYFSYAGGIDGSGELARAFNNGFVYSHVLVSDANWNAATVYSISADVLQHYEESQKQLSDKKEGHLRNEHPLTKKLGQAGVNQVIADIGNSTDTIYESNQLIYVEIEHASPRDKGRIVSLGHHFRYRWRYADTIKTFWTVNGQKVRAIVQPLPDERPASGGSPHEKPDRLSGARLLLGYVVEEADENKDSLGTSGIGTGDFTRLAGRLSVNMAVETLPAGQPQEQAIDYDFNTSTRFLENGRPIPLKILGSPRPSAVENYITQNAIGTRRDKGTLITYGDTIDDVKGELRGRKFYLHQPDAATDPTCYRDGDAETIQSDQSIIARFISSPGARFKFAIRFRDLRLWELGVILMLLQPDKLLSSAQTRATKNTQRPVGNLVNMRQAAGNRLFAHKLGHGRPLGLGSVSIAVDDVQFWKDHSTLVEDQSLLAGAETAFNEVEGIDEFILIQWLQIHRYYGRTRCEYPNNNGNIYEWHTEQRRNHAQGRRQFR